MNAATSPKSSLAKLGLYPRQKTLRVMVLGQGGVGKSAMVVRFITKRYIGEYDPTLEKVYTFQTVIDNKMVYFDILDTAGQPHETECLALEANIRWAEAFILVYSVTDKCSFDECYRLKFLINYNKRRRRLGGGGGAGKDGSPEVPVVLVGNKTDQTADRMVTPEEGQRRSKEIGCVCFHEISVRESIDQVWSVFRDVCRFWRVQNKAPGGGGKTNKEQPPSPPVCASVSPLGLITAACRPAAAPSLCRRWTDDAEDEDEDEAGGSIASSPGGEAAPFRGRASTDGHLQLRPWKWRYPPPPAASTTTTPSGYYPSRSERRMSISMRGNNASY